jgi:hypothetical protein
MNFRAAVSYVTSAFFLFRFLHRKRMRNNNYPI